MKYICGTTNKIARYFKTLPESKYLNFLKPVNAITISNPWPIHDIGIFINSYESRKTKKIAKTIKFINI